MYELGNGQKSGACKHQLNRNCSSRIGNNGSMLTKDKKNPLEAEIMTANCRIRRRRRLDDDDDLKNVRKTHSHSHTDIATNNKITK